MLQWQESDFADPYADSAVSDDSWGGFFGNAISTLGNAWGNYRREEYQAELDDIRLERLRGGFTTPAPVVQSSNNNMLMAVGALALVAVAVAVVK